MGAIILHSLSKQHFEDAVEYGGLVAPSFAVVQNPDLEYVLYGDVVCLMKPNVLDGADVFYGDGDTPVFPKIYRKEDIDAVFSLSDKYGIEFDDILMQNDYCFEESWSGIYRSLAEKGMKGSELIAETNYIADTAFYQGDYVPCVPEEEISKYVQEDRPFEEYMTPFSPEAVIAFEKLERPLHSENRIKSQEDLSSALSSLDIEHDYLEAKTYKIIGWNNVAAVFTTEDIEAPEGAKVIYYDVDDYEQLAELIQKEAAEYSISVPAPLEEKVLEASVLSEKHRISSNTTPALPQHSDKEVEYR